MMQEVKTLDERHLDNFSREFSRELFNVFPEWKTLAQIVQSKSAQTHYLLVRVPAPEDSCADHGLHIDTDNHEVTIGFDSYHAHFDWPSSDESYGNPVKFADDLIQEKLKVVSYWNDSEWRGSAIIPADQEPDFSAKIATSANKAKIRSWRGKFSVDRGLPVITSMGNLTMDSIEDLCPSQK